MAEVIVVYTVPIVVDNRPYDAQACGRLVGRIWEGWIEFASADGELLRTARETTQPNRAALQKWADNLSFAYLEGALNRALALVAGDGDIVVAKPHFSGPAPAMGAQDSEVEPHAVLDPYSAGAKGEPFLRQQLGALTLSHIRDIARAYDLVDDSVDLKTVTKSELTELIVAKVKATV